MYEISPADRLIFERVLPQKSRLLLHCSVFASEATNDKILVVIQLDGGNDGINTLVPYNDEGYAKHRTALRIPTDKLIKINDRVGFHPALRPVANLLEDSRLAIVQGVGYPNPNHGTSGPVFLAGSSVQHGLIGEPRSLTDLEDGDLKVQFDFRRIYATLLKNWLNIAPEKSQDGEFERMPLIAQS